MSVISSPVGLGLRDDDEIPGHASTAFQVSRSEFEVEGTVSKRKKMLTKKGKAFLKQLKSKQRQQAFLALTKEINTTRAQCEEPDINLEDLAYQRDVLDRLKDTLNEAQQAYDNVLENSSEREESYRWYDIKEREFTEFRIRLCEKIQSIERLSYRSRSSVSSKSRKSRGSKSERSSHVSSRDSLSRARAEAAAKAAAYQVELQFLERENEAKRLQIEKQYALAKAREKALKGILEENEKEEKIATKLRENRNQTAIKNVKEENENKQDLNISRSVTDTKPIIEQSDTKTEFVQRNKAAEVTKPSEDLSAALSQLVNLQTMQTELSSLLINQQKTSHLPVKEPPIFSGDAFEYPSFVTAFDAIIATNVSTDKDRLYYLEKYTTGKANEVIKGFLATNSETAYLEARKLLDRRFGNPEIVAENFKSKLRHWRQISDGDSRGLQDFSDFLIRCEEAMKTMNSMSELNSTQFLMTMSAKLPSYSGVKWCRHAYDLRAKSGCPVSFKDFSAFVKQEAEVANDPIFSPDALKKERKKTFPNYNSRQRPPAEKSTGRTFASSTIPEIPRTLTQPASYSHCPECNGSHILQKCEKFISASVDERHRMIKTRGLCFRCLRPGHISSKCSSKSSCKECNKHHHTLLHGAKRRTRQDQPENETSNETAQTSQTPTVADAQSNATSIAHRTDCSPNVITTCRIVQVILHHKDNPSIEVKTYALLDDASDTTFITNKIQEELGIPGVETTLNLSTMHGRQLIKVKRVDGLVAQRPDRRAQVDLPKTYAKDRIPSRKDQIPTPDVAEKWPHLQRIKDKIPELDDSLDIGLLIGCNCPKALKPKEVITGKSEDPYAVRTLLGWCIVGPVSNSQDESENLHGHSCNRTIACETEDTNKGRKFVVNEPTKELINPAVITQMFELDFTDHKNDARQSLSKNDRKFLSIVEKGIHRTEDGHYEIPLPLRDENVALPNNKALAMRRLSHLKRRFEADNGKQFKDEYVTFMSSVIESGYAEVVPKYCAPERPTQDTHHERQRVWYISHHAVYHPKKKKIRVVFDCAAEHQGHSLNKHLLQGPDLTNNLPGVLIRFRQEPIAFTCDIEGMFHQVRVNKEHRDLLRFLWWKDGDTSKEPEEYRMTVHLFGATSSPGCANFALKATANDHENEFGARAADFLRNDFYVDDGLKSVPSVQEAIELVNDSKGICSKGGFNLHKFVSNSKEVLKTIPEPDRAEGVKKIDMDLDSLPVERTLGVQWCVETDSFQFNIVLQNKPCTRRGILSTVSSIYDPLGFVAPLLLQGKSILQELCHLKLDWDDPIPEEPMAEWERWKRELTQLQRITIPRCYKPDNFGRIVKVQLHHFSDASTKGYGQCSYLRLVDENGRIHCAFVMGKSRVAPLKPVTMPRLELTAAVCSTRVSRQIHRELEYHIDEDFYWTDSQVVLGYIHNASRRFHVFVANRVQEIHESTQESQWRYIESKENPADEASRGMKGEDFPDSRWLSGPSFLWKEESMWPNSSLSSKDLQPQESDPEVKKATTMATTLTEKKSLASIAERVQRFSDWQKAKKAIALCIKYVKILQARVHQRKVPEIQVDVTSLEAAGTVIIRSVQAETLHQEIKVLKDKESTIPTENEGLPKKQRKSIRKVSTIHKLDPFIDKDGILRVGGRLNRATMPDAIKHPVILPRDSHVSSLVVKCFHEKVMHQGRASTLNEMRSSGFWLIGGAHVVNSVISSCVTCRKIRGSVAEQKMADLPEDRMEDVAPFTYSAVDYFGPFTIKEGRKEMKRYGVLFTCMSSRAVHLEVARSLDTDSFINSLRRFISRRGPVRQLRSDQGTNFVGARRELAQAVTEMDQQKIKSELLQSQCDWFPFNMNVPAASHMGGVWERQIRSVRAVLSALLRDNGMQLDDESLTTLMCEAEAIVNSRPLTTEQLGDPDAPSPLTPNHLLTMKSKIVLPPPGVFQSQDLYCRKRWRRVQHLANEFWCRWRKEFLLSLQQRSKWTRPRRNMCVGDIVLVKDENLPRNAWQLSRVAEVYPSADGFVRKVKVATADKDLDEKGRRPGSVRYLERPVQKLVLLLPAEETDRGFPAEEPHIQV